MLKSIKPCLLSFDMEWIPDPLAAEAILGIRHSPPYSLPDAFQALWKYSGATLESPRPFIKTALSRIVSIAGVLREETPGEDSGQTSVSLRLISLPSDCSSAEKKSERHILDHFLRSLGRRLPQLVGYNSSGSDLPILVQRALINGVSSHGFGKRPEKPWEGVDYFSSAGDYHIDLAMLLAHGRQIPRLDEMARLCGIPGKVDTAGDQVWELYMKGDVQSIIDYNEFDALTTHLLWSRIAYFSGLLTQDQFEAEQVLVENLIDQEISKGKKHLVRYLNEWKRLREIKERFAVL